MLFSGMHHSPTAVNFRGQLQGIGSLTRGQLIIVRLYTLPTDNISVHTNTHTHRIHWIFNLRSLENVGNKSNEYTDLVIFFLIR